METLLRATWHECVGGHPGSGAALDELLGRYREPHRRYHGIEHLRRVVRDVGLLLPGTDLPVPPAVVRLAAFFHDAVYDPTRHDNEAASAALAGRVLIDLGVGDPALGEIERLVLTTSGHTADDPAAVVLADADLAVLGGEPGVYRAYSEGVRAEYSHVTDGEWRHGRAEVLRSLLERDAIFRTEIMARNETRARANLASELRSLGQ